MKRTTDFLFSSSPKREDEAKTDDLAQKRNVKRYFFPPPPPPPSLLCGPNTFFVGISFPFSFRSRYDCVVRFSLSLSDEGCQSSSRQNTNTAEAAAAVIALQPRFFLFLLP